MDPNQPPNQKQYHMSYQDNMGMYYPYQYISHDMSHMMMQPQMYQQYQYQPQSYLQQPAYISYQQPMQLVHQQQQPPMYSTSSIPYTHEIATVQPAPVPQSAQAPAPAPARVHAKPAPQPQARSVATRNTSVNISTHVTDMLTDDDEKEPLAKPQKKRKAPTAKPAKPLAPKPEPKAKQPKLNPPAPAAPPVVKLPPLGPVPEYVNKNLAFTRPLDKSSRLGFSTWSIGMQHVKEFKDIRPSGDTRAYFQALKADIEEYCRVANADAVPPTPTAV